MRLSTCLFDDRLKPHKSTFGADRHHSKLKVNWLHINICPNTSIFQHEDFYRQKRKVLKKKERKKNKTVMRFQLATDLFDTFTNPTNIVEPFYL